MNELHLAHYMAPEAAIPKIPVVLMKVTDAGDFGKSTNSPADVSDCRRADRPDVLGLRTVPAPRANAPVAPPVALLVVNEAPRLQRRPRTKPRKSSHGGSVGLAMDLTLDMSF